MIYNNSLYSYTSTRFSFTNLKYKGIRKKSLFHIYSKGCTIYRYYDYNL